MQDVQETERPSKQEDIPQHQERALFTQQTQHYRPALVREDFFERLHQNKNRDEELPAKQAFFQEMRLLGQVQGTYIIAEYGEAVYIIDQHAAHECVRYEEIMEDFKQRKILSQKYALSLFSLLWRRLFFMTKTMNSLPRSAILFKNRKITDVY